MNRSDFTTASITVLQSSVGWQTRIAEVRGVNPRQVRRWLAANDIPTWAADKLLARLGKGFRLPWPRDEWVLGYGARDLLGHRPKYLVHTKPPRFTGRLVRVGPSGMACDEEMPADILPARSTVSATP